MDELRALTLEQATFGEQLDPLHVVMPGHGWHADLDALLPPDHYGVTSKLDGLFRAHQGASRGLHVALVGHGGTGKSTLVRQAMHGLRDISLTPIHVNARESFDHADMAFVDVVLVIAEAVLAALARAEQPVSFAPLALGPVRAWLTEFLVEEAQAGALFGELDQIAQVDQVEPDGNLELAQLAQLAARVKATLRASNPYREAIRARAQRDPEQLLRGANELLDAAHEAMGARRQRLCVVVENLEKIDDRKQVELAVLRHADDLRQLRCHAIYCLSPADQHTPSATPLDQLFRVIEVPVLPVRARRDAPRDLVEHDAHQAIRALLSKRVGVDELFADVDPCIGAIAHWSGGRLRDVLELARQACEFAHFDAQANKVDLEHIERAARKLATRRLTVMTPSCWSRAVEIHADKQIHSCKEDALMLQHSLVLAYDGEPWWDVHPFVVQDPRFWRATAEAQLKGR